MILLPISPSDKDAARQLYLESFPEHERVPPEKLEAHLPRGDAEWLGIYDDGFRGMVYLLFNRDVLFILYLAVVPSSRDMGYGSSAIEAVLERHPGRKTYLNIEPPDEECGNREQRIRRQEFYLRNGFVPCEKRRTSDGVILAMCYRDRITNEEIESFARDAGLDILFGYGDRPGSTPSFVQPVIESDLVQASPHHDIDDIVNGRGAGVESGIGIHDHHSESRQFQFVLEHYGALGGFPDEEDEPPPLLYRDRCGACDEGVGDSVGDLGHGGFAAGSDEHGIEGEAPGCDWREHIGVVVGLVGQGCDLVGIHVRLRRQYLLRGLGHDEMLLALELLKQTDTVHRTGRTAHR